MRRTSTFVATALILATSATARGTVPEPGFGPSPTGCPTFWEVDAPPLTGDINPPVGPIGTAQLHITGFGFAVEGDELTATVRVADMQRRVAPGFTKSWWIISFGTLYFRADYDLLSDSFTFIWNDFFRHLPPTPAIGRVVEGPGGGISMTAKVADLAAYGIGPHYEAETTRAAAGVKGWVDQQEAPGMATGLAFATGPERVPLVVCPGLSLAATLHPFDEGDIIANGVTLPKLGGQPIELQLLQGSEWTTIGTGSSGDDGVFEITATPPKGTVTLRASVTTAAGVGTSAPIQLNVP